MRSKNTFVPIDFVELFNSLLSLLVTEQQVQERFTSNDFFDKWRKKFCNTKVKSKYLILSS